MNLELLYGGLPGRKTYIVVTAGKDVAKTKASPHCCKTEHLPARMDHPISKHGHNNGTHREPKNEYCSHYGTVRVAQYLILLSSLLLGGAFFIAIIMAAVLLGSRCFVEYMSFGQVSLKPFCNDPGTRYWDV